MADPVFHSSRYPKHNEQGRGNKGQIFGGECNRTRCTAHGATWFNRGTYAYECEQHAKGANAFPTDGQVPCVETDGQLTLDMMNFYVTELKAKMAMHRKAQ
ncbi:MAG: hypothetical protein OSB62_04055 [Alphaproteobacteria bacterium]|nr:hypothetical protein [Alphaproteobacteria bacterium]